MNKVEITVTGQVGTGKSSISHCIKSCLENKGFKDISIEDYDMSDANSVRNTLDKRLKSLSENNLEIGIKVKQKQRSHKCRKN